MSVALGLFGAGGRLGRSIVDCLETHPGLSLKTALGRGPGDFTGCDVVIDVSVADATDDLLGRLGSAALVTGVTGRTPAQQKRIDDLAAERPVLVAANFSLGVALLRRLVTQAAAALPGFDAEIFEVHHRHKRDAPSGTALALGAAVAAGQGLPWPDAKALRDGPTGPRGDAEVGLSAARGGEVIGEHTVFFFGPAERIELTHRAGDRALFAHGALRAAGWLAGRAPGRYTMDAVLDPGPA